MSTTRVRTPTSTVRLGYARVDVTPPVGIYHRLWGAARHDRATGVHRPLYADVLALGPAGAGAAGAGAAGADRPALVRAFLDLAGLAQAQQEAVVRAAAEGAGVPPDHVVLTHSHTHSSGWFVPDRIPLPGGELILPYIAELTVRVRDAARQAAQRMARATISYATGRCDMAANRDYWDDARSAFACGFNPDATPDDTLIVGRVTGENGGLVCTLANYACHPTTLAWENSLISPDYAGALRETVERVTGAPCVFAQGACGDLGPTRGFSGDTRLADRNGEQEAHAALAALAGLGPPATDLTYAGPVVSGATLGTWHDAPHDPARVRDTERFAGGRFTVDLPLKPRPDRGALTEELASHEAAQRDAEARGDMQAARDAGALAERARRWLARLDDFPPGDTYPLHCAVHRLGDALWVATGGEPYSALQTALRRRFPEHAVLVSPLLGDLQVAYLLTRDAYGTGRYQEEPSILAPGCLETLIDAVAAEAAQLL